MGYKQDVERVLSKAGIKINGKNPWDITVHNSQVYRQMVLDGTVGVGESYMDGWWDCKQLDEMARHIYTSDTAKELYSWRLFWYSLEGIFFNLQKRSRAYQIGKKHYDIGNDLYSKMLDKRMTYSCGYWKNAKTLDEAQEAKLDLTCKKLHLKKGMTLLDVGCGWGSLVKYAAEHYGVRALGITVSKEQAKLARIFCKGLPIEIKLQDYRDINLVFDRVVSVGMFEHVGYKNYKPFMKKMRCCVKPDGLFLLHTIGGRTSVRRGDPWIEKYIFPNSMIPSEAQITKASEGVFTIEDWHNFGPDYDKTLLAWHANFTRHWPELEHTYGKRFYRMWVFYLLTCAGSFRARKNQVWQIVLSPNGVGGGYSSKR